jgi:hypothetical protein
MMSASSVFCCSQEDFGAFDVSVLHLQTVIEIFQLGKVEEDAGDQVLPGFRRCR